MTRKQLLQRLDNIRNILIEATCTSNNAITICDTPSAVMTRDYIQQVRDELVQLQSAIIDEKKGL